ncbi:MAG: hypothetical protein JXR73_16020 [Candidatus Omnitrophica bacterium]|nr:hypothetical protein [Candidatus Omnitrophota bacterium]
MWKKISMMLLAAAFVVVADSPALCQDKVSELEKKIEALEVQLNDLKTMLEEQKTAPAAEAPAVEEPAAPITKLIGPGGTLRVGGDIRFRGLYYDNVWDFDTSNGGDQRDVIRFRPRVFLDWKPTDDIEAYVRMTKEWFYGQDNERPGYDVEGKDVMFDNAWGQWTDMFGLPLTLRIGRQDLIYGDGFVILDGTPNDGSQTISFDAAKMTLSHDWGTTDLLYAKMAELDNEDADDEDLYGIYNKFKIDDWNLGLEPYFLVRNKNDGPDFSGIAPLPNPNDPIYNPDGTIAGYNTWGVSYPYNPFDPSPKEETYYLGMRATYDFDIADGVNLGLAAEGGKQWGKVDFTGSPLGGSFGSLYGFSRFDEEKVDRDAWGGQFHGTLTFKDAAWTPSVKAGVAYYSGDDPNTEDYEGWDDFYAQWPKYSELYVYSLYDGFKFGNRANDPDVGMWSNMLIPEIMLTVKPTDRWTQSIRALYYLAEEDNGPGDGDERGINLQWLSNYVFTKNLSGHFLFEWFDPGDYYDDDADEALFTRFQIMYTF